MNMLGNLLNLIKPVRLSVDEEIIKKVSEQSPDNASMMEVAFSTVPKAKGRLLTTAEILQHFGKPGDPDNLTTIEPPFPMYLAWDPTDRVEKISCHKKIALPLMNVFNDILTFYGEKRIKELGIDQFGGCVNFRAQRRLEKKYEAAIKAKKFQLAYTYLSRHAWGIPIDLDPARNDLTTRAPKAQFSKPEYEVMNNIFYQHGFIGYGRERGNDWMHYEYGII